MNLSDGALSADDTLVYLSDPLNSVPKLMDCFAKFGTLSGYKINVNKISLNSLITQQMRAAYQRMVFPKPL